MEKALVTLMLRPIACCLLISYPLRASASFLYYQLSLFLRHGHPVSPLSHPVHVNLTVPPLCPGRTAVQVYDAWYNLAPVCPQLYLYSDADPLVPPGDVEKYMEIQVRVRQGQPLYGSQQRVCAESDWSCGLGMTDTFASGVARFNAHQTLVPATCDARRMLQVCQPSVREPLDGGHQDELMLTCLAMLPLGSPNPHLS